MEAAISLTSLVERHRREILAYVSRLLGDRDEAEDVCQEVFLRAHRAFSRLSADSNGRAWLYRIATRRALTALRRRRRAAHPAMDPDELAGPAANPEGRDELRRVRRAVESLPSRQRAALMLRRFQDLSYAEIAAVMGGSATLARANVYQAVRRLRAILSEEPS